jgi:hypothetical protein
MSSTDPNAVWLMQGWLFLDQNFWKPQQVQVQFVKLLRNPILLGQGLSFRSSGQKYDHS